MNRVVSASRPHDYMVGQTMEAAGRPPNQQRQLLWPIPASHRPWTIAVRNGTSLVGGWVIRPHRRSCGERVCAARKQHNSTRSASWLVGWEVVCLARPSTASRLATASPQHKDSPTVVLYCFNVSEPLCLQPHHVAMSDLS